MSTALTNRSETATETATATETEATTAAPADATPEAPRGLLAVVLTATFMTALDFFVVNVAVPSVQADLGAGPAAVQWVIAGFSLALAAGLVTAGRLGDRYGRRRVFGLGLALFTLASAGCGLAPTAAALVGARVVQGLAAALMGPQVLAILRTAFSGAAQARAFARYALTMGVGSVFGQLIGGLLIRADLFGLGWRSCFLINLPIGLAALALVRRCLPESRAPQRPGLDPVGVLLVTAALTGLVLPLIQGPQQGWPLWTWLCLGGSAALLAGFTVHQHRARDTGSPLVDTRLFRTRSFGAGLLAQLAFWLGQASFFLVLALHLQLGRGLDALGAGLVFTAIGLGYLLTSNAAHRVAARLGGRRTITVGGLLMAAGLGLLALAVYGAPGGSVWWLAPGLFVDGLGMGLVIAPVTSVVLAGVEPRLAGSAAGVLATVQQVGGALGIALIGLLYYGAGDPVAAFGRSVTALAVLELVLVGLVRLLPRRG
ncbi:EmrB/QacA subfamily drug resistance transporter [Kitasatospora sp. MAA19]|uniref:MFS transporter n=1 Tax=Kitasatospora sp. MAA19 TaxID=3035090 RepID=UPI0024757E15|nr:MFS transporter [Kitasatospora sp. MAA19]MDH6703411.1 EmrB/QacA subfamily drug resistance transporter [Kitasatospora sp. MAA19]